MLLNTDYILPADLTGYVREAFGDLQVNQFTLSRWLPNNAIDDLEYRFTAGGEGLVEAATFRAYDAPTPFGSRPGVRRVTGELPPISRQIRLGEYDRLRQRNLPTNDPVVRMLERDGIRMSRAVAARIELARGDALTNGSVTIDENGVIATVDFGRSSTHTVTAATSWATVASATVLTDLVAWFDTYKADNGVAPGVILTSTKQSRLMQRNVEVINAIAGSNTGRTRVTSAELDALLQSEGLPPIRVNDAQVSVGGTSTRVIPDSVVLLLPAPGDSNDPATSELGATLWGTTAESLEPDYGIEAGEEPGIVAGVYKTQDPVALFTKAAGISLPVLANPDLSFKANV